MTQSRGLGDSVDTGSGRRQSRTWRILLAHDATASTCDLLVDAIDAALGRVDISESSSSEDARLALSLGHFDICFVCLDLPPAPAGGIRLAQEILDSGLPIVLITRSLRWIPPSAARLREQPWVTPDADSGAVQTAVDAALEAMGLRESWAELEAASVRG